MIISEPGSEEFPVITISNYSAQNYSTPAPQSSEEGFSPAFQKSYFF